jgi:serine/threonine protein kinase
MQVFRFRHWIQDIHYQLLTSKFCDFVETYSFNIECLLLISDSAMSTLECIHRAGIIHDDIRPENILIGDLGVTIIDFGHARRCNNKKAHDSECEVFQAILRGSAGENQ